MNRFPPVKTPFGPSESRYRVVIETDVCAAGTQQSRMLQFELLRHIAEQPMLTACGPAMFQSLKMRHDGQKWVVECEAIVPNP